MLFPFQNLLWLVVLGSTGQDTAPPSEPPVPRAIHLRLDGPCEINMGSPLMKYRDRDVSAVRVGGAVFTLSGTHLTAKLSGGINMVGTRDYEMHAAVFDGDGILLATDRITVNVRPSISSPQLAFESFDFDFGESHAFRDAKWFVVTFSHPDPM